MIIKKISIVIASLVVLIFTLNACGTATTIPFPPPTTLSTTAAAPTVTTTPAVTTTVPTTTPPETTTTPPAITPTTITYTGPLQVTTGAVSGITKTSALFSGSLAGGQGINKQGFEWGVSPGQYDYSFEATGMFEPGAFSHLVTDLTPNTVYYYRGNAHDINGWAYGAEMTFRTIGVPQIAKLSPSTALIGKTVDVTITGTDFTTTTAVDFGSGITVNGYTVNSDTQIVANITIAADTATGARPVTVTTKFGADTLTDGFTVQEQKTVLHYSMWTNSQFGQMIHDMTSGSSTPYVLQFHDGGEVTLMAERNITMWVQMVNGKLCIQNVAQTYWDSIFSYAGQYLSYDSDKLLVTFNSLPYNYLQTMFDIPKDSIPDFVRIVTGEGILTVYYEQLDIVG